jgi:predicted RNA binding protein YcfA (HicA-like mRNA interferase family)
MKLPRDISGRKLATALQTFGYEVVRRRGGHMRLTTRQNGEHHLTIPDHDALRSGTLAGIISDVAEHLGLNRDEVMRQLFE